MLLITLLALAVGADAREQAPPRAPNPSVTSTAELAPPPRPHRRDVRLHLGRYHWDPLIRPLPFAAEPGAPIASTKYVVVQFHRALDPRQRSALRQLGFRLEHYVEALGFIETRDALVRLQRHGSPAIHSLVRAVVPYLREFKSIGVVEALRHGTPAGRALRIVLHHGEEATAARNAIIARLVTRDVALPEGHPDWALPELQFVPATPYQVLDVLDRDEVRWVEWIRRPETDSGADGHTIPLFQSGATNAWPLWENELHGEAQVIGVIDYGVLQAYHCFFAGTGKVVAIRNARDSDVNEHATRVTGIVAGDDVDAPGAHPARGLAWAAKVTYGNVRDLEPSDSGPMHTLASYLAAAADDGAHVHTNSWHLAPEEWMAFPGTDAAYEYDYAAHQTDAFMWHDETQVVLASASNRTEPLGAPAVAFSTLAVGAAQYTSTHHTWCDGSKSATEDGRAKPEICAPGYRITTSFSRGPRSVLDDGTCAASWATPAAAGAAVLIRQYFLTGRYPGVTDPTSALVRAVLVNATRPLPLLSADAYPCRRVGFGATVLDDTLFFAGDERKLLVRDVANAEGLDVGQTATYAFDLDDSSEELRITVAWTAPPGTPPFPVTNDLDLVVTAPDGSIMIGNATGGNLAADTVNKVEMVRVTDPTVGRWTVEVKARELVVLLEEARQGYALCISGGVSD